MRYFLISIIFSCVQLCLAQTADLKNGKTSNEIKLNLAHAVFLEAVEISYERLIGQKSTLGLSLGYPWSIHGNYRFDFQAIPYYRFHFGRKRAKGFFLEGHLAFYSEETDPFARESVFGLGTGIAFGQKFVINGVWIIEAYLGGGINHINTDKINNGYPRFGLSIGKRF